MIHRLVSTADDSGPPGYDEQYGHGIVNVVAALTADVPPMAPLVDEPDEIRQSQWHLDALQLPAAHEISRGDGITVALVGPGVAGGHPDLHRNLLPGVDLAEPDRPDALTPTLAGTALAGLIAGHGNRLFDHEPGQRGVLGVAPEATILPVRVSGADLPDRQAIELAAQGIEWAVANGAQIVCYVGGIASQDLFADAIEAAQAAGALVVAPAGGAPDQALWYPAANPAVVAAVAVDDSGAVAPDQLPSAPPQPGAGPLDHDPAEVGPLLAAPGVALVSTAPDAGYTEDSPAGSAAAAIVAGAAAVVWAAHPELTGQQVAHRLTATADPAGRVDLLAALTADVPLPEPPPAAREPGGTGGGGPQWSFGPVVTAVLLATALVIVVGGAVLWRARTRRPEHQEPTG